MTEQQRKGLAAMMRSQIMAEAIDKACASVPSTVPRTIETMALDKAFLDGVLWGFTNLYAMAGHEKKVIPKPRRLIREAPIR